MHVFTLNEGWGRAPESIPITARYRGGSRSLPAAPPLVQSENRPVVGTDSTALTASFQSERGASPSNPSLETTARPKRSSRVTSILPTKRSVAGGETASLSFRMPAVVRSERRHQLGRTSPRFTLNEGCPSPNERRIVDTPGISGLRRNDRTVLAAVDCDSHR